MECYLIDGVFPSSRNTFQIKCSQHQTIENVINCTTILRALHTNPNSCTNIQLSPNSTPWRLQALFVSCLLVFSLLTSYLNFVVPGRCLKNVNKRYHWNVKGG